MKGGLKDKLLAFGQQAAAAAAHGAKAAAKLASQEVLGAQCLLEYQVGAQVASSGPLGLWKVYSARSKKEGEPLLRRVPLFRRLQTCSWHLGSATHHDLCYAALSPHLCSPHPPGSLHPVVSAWVLDKRELTQTEEVYGGGSLARPSQRRLEAFIEQCRRDVQARAVLQQLAAQLLGKETRWQACPAGAVVMVLPPCILPTAAQALARLKHPGVLRLVAPLEETRTQLVFITEPVFASLADLLGGPACSLPPAAAAERRELHLSGGGRCELERGHAACP